MSYTVLLDIKGKWFSDNKPFAKFADARRYQGEVARRNAKYCTAVAHGDRVLNFQESEDYKRWEREERKQCSKSSARPTAQG